MNDFHCRDTTPNPGAHALIPLQLIPRLAPGWPWVKVTAFRVARIMTRKPPDALLLLATGCAHCAGVLEGLTELLKQGRIGRLEAVNIAEHPQTASTLDVRSVPWTLLGPFALVGAMTPGELARWAELAATDEGFAVYYSHLLQTRRPHEVSQSLARHPSGLAQLIGLLADEDTPMAVRIGVGVVMDELAGSALLASGLDALIALAGSKQANTRADAAHYLGLTRQPGAAATLKALLHDPHADVREIAAEALQTLTDEENDG
jgi:thiol-disulfide isomerase/thioredoxin